MRFAPHSLRVRFQNLAGRVSMDLRAVQNLELLPQYSGGGGGGGGGGSAVDIASQLNFLFAAPEDLQRAGGGPSAKRGVRKRSSAACLFDLFPCRTGGGARSLRNSLLWPLSDPQTLQSRLDMVALLLADESAYFSLCELLPQFSDLDRVSAAMVQIPRAPSPRTTAAQIGLLLTLGNSIALLPRLLAVVNALAGQARAQQARQAKARQQQREPANNNNEGSGSGSTSTSSGDNDEPPSTSNTAELLSALSSNLSSAHYSSLQRTLTAVMDTNKTKMLHKSNVQFARFKIIFAGQSGGEAGS